MMQRQQSEVEVTRIVGQIDAMRRDLFDMEHIDKPDGRAFRERGRQDIRITRAKTRLRTAAWRKRMAENRTATADQVSRAILAALVTSSTEDLLQSDRTLINRALADLKARGFDVSATAKSLRRMRNDLMDPDDREGEQLADLAPSTWPTKELATHQG